MSVAVSIQESTVPAPARVDWTMKACLLLVPHTHTHTHTHTHAYILLDEGIFSAVAVCMYICIYVYVYVYWAMKGCFLLVPKNKVRQSALLWFI
jgi:hypothetical protein